MCSDVEAEGRRCSPALANPDMMGAQPSAASARPVCSRTKLTSPRAHWLLSHICHVTAHDPCQHRLEDYPRAAIV
ncbi:hypothetical protein FIBSPDRAFT_868595 [Athelia psychrophila]|uniref:Uncharacterized protein n=1 Tax=Athelia psychrophila TaxID=1759441 RepID=A0A166CX72_9AGAM|nr:hypothetical protein FIBSPDRAFT_868595 [Fibularhizoctonia sp. CBS 109695]